jgi:hypothetical protein
MVRNFLLIQFFYCSLLLTSSNVVRPCMIDILCKFSKQEKKETRTKRKEDSEGMGNY